MAVETVGYVLRSWYLMRHSGTEYGFVIRAAKSC
jgi:hypothetical protein